MNSLQSKNKTRKAGVDAKELRLICLVNVTLYVLDLVLHYYTTPLAEFIFRPLHTLLLLVWFIRVSPAPFTTRNILMMTSVFILTAYPFQSMFFGSRETETYLEILLPFVANILLIIVFLKDRRKVKAIKSPGMTLNWYFLYIITPAAYYYFVLYQTIADKPYFALTIIYTVVFILMMMTGGNLNFRKSPQTIILVALGLLAFTTAINTYNIFIEKIPYSYPLICFLNMFSPLLFLWGFANEDIIRKKAGK